MEGKQKYRQQEDGQTPEQLKVFRTHTDRTTKEHWRRQHCTVSHYRSCSHTKCGVSPREPMNGGIECIAHAESPASKKNSTEFQGALYLRSSHGRAKTKQTVEVSFRGGVAQQRRVSELQCCNCGRWGSEGSSYVVDGQEQSRRRGCCTVTSTGDNPAVYCMY